MSWLITSDLHQTDNPKDEYRWGIFNWLAQKARRHGVTDIFILGDMTNAKDRHSAKLVNRMVHELAKLHEVGSVYLLKGNHDFIDPDNPFFEFTKNLMVRYLKSPCRMSISTQDCVFLPSTKDHHEWEPVLQGDPDFIFAHGTFEGTLGESGFPLPGIPQDIFEPFPNANVFAGDIHRPGIVGRVEYVGSPYRTHFGDTYTPRVILINDDGEQSDLHFPCPSKHLIVMSKIKDLERFSTVRAGDQIKVRIMLRRDEYDDLPTLKKDLHDYAAERGWDICAVEPKLLAPRRRLDQPVIRTHRTPEETIKAFAATEKLTDDQTKLGLELVNGRPDIS